MHAFFGTRSQKVATPGAAAVRAVQVYPQIGGTPMPARMRIGGPNALYRGTDSDQACGTGVW